MYHIVYKSRAAGLPTIADLRRLLLQSSANNTRLGITGLLLYAEGYYMQVLEGDAAAVQQLYASIQADSRHTCVETLSEGAIKERIFQNWSMAFQTLPGEDFRRLTGYIDAYRSRAPNAYQPALDEEMLCLLKSFAVNADSLL
jgi:Sensors of blue-light using FAD